MTERTTLTTVSQIGVESTPGTAVAATKKLLATNFMTKPQGNIKKFRPMGLKFPTIAAMGKEWAEHDIEGYPSYNDLSYLLASLVSYAAPAQQGGTAAYLWTFAPSSSVEDTVKTFTVEQGSRVRAHRTAYTMINSLSLEGTREEVSISGSALAQKIADGVDLSTNAEYTLTANATPPTAGTFTLTYSGQTTAAIAFDATAAAVQAALEALSNIAVGEVTVTATTAAATGKLDTANNVYTVEFREALGQAPITLTGTFTGLTASGSIALASSVTGVTPTEIAVEPILPEQVDIYLDATSGGLGGTKLTRVLGWSWEYGDRFSPLWTVNSAATSFAAHTEKEPKCVAELTLEADSSGMALLTAMRAGTTKFLRIVATGVTISGIYTYKLQIDMAVKVGEMIEFSDEDGVYAVKVPLTAMHDSGWGKAMTIALTNVITAL